VDSKAEYSALSSTRRPGRWDHRSDAVIDTRRSEICSSHTEM